MNNAMRNSVGKNRVDVILRLAVILSVMVLNLSACSQDPDKTDDSASSSNFSAPLPAALISIESSNLVVTVVDNGTSRSCSNVSVNSGDGTFSCRLTLDEGSHTLSLVFSIIDETYGSVQVASTSNIQVNVVSGQSTNADFSGATLSYSDNDNDGVTNLDELYAGTDPGNSVCNLGTSIVGSCTLG